MKILSSACTMSLWSVLAIGPALGGCGADTPARAGEAPAADSKADVGESARERRAEAREERKGAREAPTETRERDDAPEGELSAAERQELLTGYALLAKTLDDETNLGKLEIVKKLMLDSPNKSISKLMDGLSQVSETRAGELKELRKLAPDVSDEPAKKSPMGEAINEIAKDFGKDDMLSRNAGFDVRFVLVQAQATRMVAAMSSALARFDPNPKRQEWLKGVAKDYENYRGDLIQYLGGKSADK